jgi:hypothetical protein
VAVINLFKDGAEAAKKFLSDGHVLDGEPDVVWTDYPGYRLVFLKCKRCRLEYTWDTDTKICILNPDAKMSSLTFDDSFLSGCPGEPPTGLKLL